MALNKSPAFIFFTSLFKVCNVCSHESIRISFVGFQGWCCSAHICCAACWHHWQGTGHTRGPSGGRKTCTYEARRGVSPETAWWLHNRGSASKKSVLSNKFSDLYSQRWSFLCQFVSLCARQWEFKFTVCSNLDSITAVVLLICTVSLQIHDLSKFEVL